MSDIPDTELQYRRAVIDAYGATAAIRILANEQRIRELEAEVAGLKEAYELAQQDCVNLTEKVLPTVRERAEAAEAKLAAVRKELEYAVSASIEGNDVDVVAEDSIRGALDGLLKRTILYNDPCAGSYEVLDPPTTDELEALLKKEDGL